MTNTIPCVTDSDEWRFDPVNLDRAKFVENYADNLMLDCKRLTLARLTNSDGDLYDGDLLPMMMVEIASWSGRSDDAALRMRNLHNLLANALNKMAELEVAK